MSDVEEESSTEDIIRNSVSVTDEEFVGIVGNYIVVFSKSQTPTVRDAKNKALKNIRQEIMRQFGKTFTESQIIKKINNMKSRLKKKTDKKATGNKVINLKSWEKKLYDILKGETNPTIAKMKGAVSIGLKSATFSSACEVVSEEDASNSSSENSKLTVVKPQLIATKKRSSTVTYKSYNNLETDETRNLTISELQRLVLLEQLQVLRLKKEKLNRESVNNEVVL